MWPGARLGARMRVCFLFRVQEPSNLARDVCAWGAFEALVRRMEDVVCQA